jgi:pSer/pThr/pTyr-binding forkhead associated (FHA) protein
LRITVVATKSMRNPDDERRPRRARRPLGLEFIEPADRAGEYVEIADVVIAGRGMDCDLPLHDTYLSTRHARFTQNDGALIIEDLGSTNGTYVNQELLSAPIQVQKGDIIQLGEVIFEVVR